MLQSFRRHLGLGSALLAALLFIDMAVLMRDVSPSIVQAQLSFSRAGFEAVAGRWSPQALQQVRQHFPIDFAFILCFSVAGFLAGRRWLTQAVGDPQAASPGVLARLMPGLLPVAGLCDLTEDLLHLRFLSAGGSTATDSAYLVAGIAASCKWALFALFLGYAARRWWLRRRASSS